ncbi:hypothetical protein J6590_052227 [Homalodisca vitripennis]|nr:hypothetical protein J6590_052227 [Homalodisca vitripennis]
MASRDEVFLRSSELSAYVDNVLNESDSDSGDLDGETVNINDDNDEISDNDGRSDSSDDDDDNDNRPNLHTWTWTNDTNTVRQINFTGNSGINPIVSRQLNADCTELDVLNQFLTNEFWDKVVSETNKYAREKILGGGYCYNFKIYTGKEITNDTTMLVSEQVVLTMTEDLVGEGRLMFMDNWYSSPNLFWSS